MFGRHGEYLNGTLFVYWKDSESKEETFHPSLLDRVYLSLLHVSSFNGSCCYLESKGKGVRKIDL